MTSHVRRTRRWSRFTALAGVLALALTACGGGNGADEPAGDATTGDTATAGGDADAAAPGEGVEVTLARANWSTGYLQSHVVKQLLEELGYEVTDPADNELGPPQFYPALAQGEVDLWANGWFPNHDPQLEATVPGGGTVGEMVTPVGYEVEKGALQGFLVDKATADEHGITSMTDLEDPEIAALFDTDGNGKADLIGCNDGWGCNGIIEEHLETHAYGENVEQVVGAYSALMADVVARVDRGEPTLFYTWTPNWTVDVLEPGTDVVWLDAPELAAEEGQTSVDGLEGCAAGDSCRLGWIPSDVRIVANNEFLEQNPAAAALFEQISIPLEDIAAQNAEMRESDSYSEADIAEDATEWIEANRDQVDAWLEAARNAA